MTVERINSILKVEPYCGQNIDKDFHKVADHAEYNGNDYKNAIHVERGISLEEAKAIAANDPEIDYFFFVKGEVLILEVDENCDPENDPLNLLSHQKFIRDDGTFGEGYVRVFQHGDVVFFKNEGKWLGAAPGLADVYEKTR